MSDENTLYEYEGRDDVSSSWSGESVRLMYSPENGVELKALNWEDNYGDTVIDPIPLPDIEVVKLAAALNKQVDKIATDLIGKQVLLNEYAETTFRAIWSDLNPAEYTFHVGVSRHSNRNTPCVDVFDKHETNIRSLVISLDQILECRALYLAQQAASE